MLLAEKRAEETKIAADAERVRAAVEAEAQRLLNEAENVLTDQARYSLFRRKLLDRIEGIVRESVKPMEKIEGIRILQVDGLNGGGGGGGGGRSATDEVINSALRYRVQAPLIDSILADIGVEGGSLAKMPGLIREARDMQGIKEVERARAARASLKASPTRRLPPPASPPPNAARARKVKSTPWPGSTSPPSSTPATTASGRACATSTACRTGIPRSRKAASRAASPRTRSDACGIFACATATASAKSCSGSPTTTCSAPTRSWSRRWGWRTTSRPCG